MLAVSNGPLRWLSLVAICVLWVLVTVTAFWWFQFRSIQPFDRYFAEFQGSTLATLNIAPAWPKTALVVHLMDQNCDCNRFAKPHIETLEQKHVGSVEFLSIQSQDPRALKLRELAIPAGPAVAIWHAGGELAYFGPYSAGPVCGEGSDFVELTLAQLEAGENPRLINTDTVGCYCPWQPIAEELNT